MLKLEWLREFIRSDFYYDEADFEESNVPKDVADEKKLDYKLVGTN